LAADRIRLPLPALQAELYREWVEEPESGYRTPVDFVVKGFEIVADAFGGFGKRLKIA
jgi:hypothetical protein